MRFRIPLATGALALGLLATAGRPAAAQDVTPPVSRDTSKAEKVRADTMAPADANAGDPQGYRAMGAPEKCVDVATGLPADKAPGDTSVTRIGDTLNVAATPDSAADRAAEAAGVYRPEKKPCPAGTVPAKVDADKVEDAPAPVDPSSAAPAKPDSIVKPTPDSAGAIVR